jgi:hypothetical protein
LNLLVVVAEASGTIHDMTMHTNADWLYGSVIALLLSIVGWFLIRDRGSIKETLDRLVEVVEGLRLDLAANYAKRLDLEKLDRKVEKLREHMTERGHERRTVEDSEA